MLPMAEAVSPGGDTAALRLNGIAGFAPTDNGRSSGFDAPPGSAFPALARAHPGPEGSLRRNDNLFGQIGVLVRGNPMDHRR